VKQEGWRVQKLLINAVIHSHQSTLFLHWEYGTNEVILHTQNGYE
jgi:hypothetical protein